MRIGIFDYDTMIDKKKFIPNLEAMKVSAYYKSIGAIVELVPRIERYSQYDKFFVFKNRVSKDKDPEIWIKPNVVCSGLEFSDKYIPLQKEIEEQVPDVSIYNKFLRVLYFEEKISEYEIMSLTTQTNYVRIVCGETRCNLDKLSFKRKLYLYDDYLENTLENKQALEKLYLLRKDKILTVSKLEFDSEEDFFELVDTKHFLGSCRLCLKKVLTYKQYKELITKCIDRKIPRAPTVKWTVQGKCSAEDYCKEIILTLNKGFYSRSKGLHCDFDYVFPVITSPFDSLCVKVSRYFQQRSFSNDFDCFTKEMAVKRELFSVPIYGAKLKHISGISVKKIKEKGGWQYYGW